MTFYENLTLKIKKVFFSAYDSDKRSRKKSKNIFKRKGILTKGSLLKKDGLSFYQSYYLQHSNNLPLIDAKIAISKDYFTKNIKKPPTYLLFFSDFSKK